MTATLTIEGNVLVSRLLTLHANSEPFHDNDNALLTSHYTVQVPRAFWDDLRESLRDAADALMKEGA